MIVLSQMPDVVDELHGIRKELNEIRRRAEVLRGFILEHGGGESDLLIARIAPVRAHIKNVQAHQRVTLHQKD